MAQHGFGLFGIATRFPVQDQGWGLMQAACAGTACPDQHAGRRRQELDGDIAPAQRTEDIHDLIQAITAMDESERAIRFERLRGDLEPAAEIGGRFDRGESLAGIG